MDLDKRNAQIRAMAKAGKSMIEIGEKYGLTRSMVNRIVTGKTYRPKEWPQKITVHCSKCPWKGQREKVKSRPCKYCGSPVVASKR